MFIICHPTIRQDRTALSIKKTKPLKMNAQTTQRTITHQV